jgi:tRNA(Ile)-lysidine synthase
MKKRDLTSILENRFLAAVSYYGLFEPGDKVLAGVSGGPDSVLLALFLYKYRKILNIKPLLIHVNHNLRGLDSLGDESFTRELASKLGLDYILKNIYPQKYARDKKVSLETASRILRYRAFEEARKESGCRKIATAHHLDDLIETMLFRLFKGCGVSSLIAMTPSSRCIIRPLLFFEKKDILSYLEENNIEYRRDFSNLDLRIDRNFIRNKIIPLIDSRFHNFRMKMLGLYKIILGEEEVWDELMRKLESSKIIKNGKLILNKKYLLIGDKGEKSLLKRFFYRELRAFSNFEFNPDSVLLERMVKFSIPISGNKIIFNNGSIRIISSYDSLIIDKTVKKFPKKSIYVRIKRSRYIKYGEFRLKIDKISGSVTSADLNIQRPDSCIFNTEGIEGFTIREKLDGDRFGLSASGTKKIQDFFIDEKIGLDRREESFILEEKRGHIIAFYVPGYGFRVSAEFYVKRGFKDAVRLSLENSGMQSGA